MKPRDTATYIFLAIAWGLSFLVVLRVVEAFGWVGAVAFRSFIAAGTLFAIAKLSGRKLDFQAGWKPFAVVGATTVAGQLIGLSYGTPLIGTAMAAICVASIPLFSMVISQLWGLERITSRGLIGLLLGVTGIVLLVGFPAVAVTPEFIMGCVAVLFSCFSAAFGSNYASRRLSGTGSWETTIGAFVFGGILTLPLIVAIPVPAMPGLVDFIYLLISACVMSALTYVLYFRLVGNVGPTKAISVEFAVTVIAVLVGAVFLKEQLSIIQFVGAAVIIAGCALVLSSRPALPKEAEAFPGAETDETSDNNIIKSETI
ncbi:MULTISPECIES: DMT family transporter [Brucella]|uniref:DMT family transporter n=1 Tax=Brucella TaxID=234 RepID=UPI0009A1D4FF|nr:MULTISPECIES: EamA family transporter [Brucella]KAB2690935.1 EamA family transporter [Brucella pseudogrignonensis]MCD4510804.1 EamA family transporter [Brucella pseudogrignonensis]